MTLSEIVESPDEDTLTFEGERLQELTSLLSGVKAFGYASASEMLAFHHAVRVTISPVKGLARMAFDAFQTTDAPCGYAFGREWFYQNATGDATSLVVATFPSVSRQSGYGRS